METWRTNFRPSWLRSSWCRNLDKLKFNSIQYFIIHQLVENSNAFLFIGQKFEVFVKLENFDDTQCSYFFESFQLQDVILFLLSMKYTCAWWELLLALIIFSNWVTGDIKYFNTTSEEYKAIYLNEASDYITKDDSDGVQVILLQLFLKEI